MDSLLRTFFLRNDKLGSESCNDDEHCETMTDGMMMMAISIFIFLVLAFFLFFDSFWLLFLFVYSAATTTDPSSSVLRNIISLMSRILMNDQVVRMMMMISTIVATFVMLLLLLLGGLLRYQIWSRCSQRCSTFTLSPWALRLPWLPHRVVFGLLAIIISRLFFETLDCCCGWCPPPVSSCSRKSWLSLFRCCGRCFRRRCHDYFPCGGLGPSSYIIIVASTS